MSLLGGPIPFITIEDSGGFHLNEEAANILKGLKGKLAIVAIAGLYRTGKSLILNMLLKTAPGAPVGGNTLESGGFQVGSTVNACTKGLWMWSQPLRLEDGTNVIFIDTEGLGSTERGQTQDTRIFAMALLLSSYFIYNSRGVIDGNALDDLSLVVNLSNHIHSSTRTDGQEELSNHFPFFMWLLRDFTLKLQKDGQKITSKQYLEDTLVQAPGFDDASASRNQVRMLLSTFFRERDCVTLARPVEDEAQLRDLGALPYDDLRLQFRKGFEQLTGKLWKRVTPKTVCGSAVDGGMLVELAKAYVGAFNDGKAPVIASAWTRVVESRCEEAVEHAVERFKDLINTRVVNYDPEEAKTAFDDIKFEEERKVEEDEDAPPVFGGDEAAAAAAAEAAAAKAKAAAGSASILTIFGFGKKKKKGGGGVPAVATAAAAASSGAATAPPASASGGRASARASLTGAAAAAGAAAGDELVRLPVSLGELRIVFDECRGEAKRLFNEQAMTSESNDAKPFKMLLKERAAVAFERTALANQNASKHYCDLLLRHLASLAFPRTTTATTSLPPAKRASGTTAFATAPATVAAGATAAAATATAAPAPAPAVADADAEWNRPEGVDVAAQTAADDKLLEGSRLLGAGNAAADTRQKLERVVQLYMERARGPAKDAVLSEWLLRGGAKQFAAVAALADSRHGDAVQQMGRRVMRWRAAYQHGAGRLAMTEDTGSAQKRALENAMAEAAKDARNREEVLSAKLEHKTLELERTLERVHTLEKLALENKEVSNRALESMSSQSAVASASGYLRKKGPDGGLGFMWKERFFVLDREAKSLMYYKSKDDYDRKRTAAAVDLRQYSDVELDRSDGISFSLCAAAASQGAAQHAGVYRLRAADDTDRHRWVDLLVAAGCELRTS